MANKNYWSLLKRPMAKYFWGENIDGPQPPSAVNNEYISAVDAAGTGLVNLLKANASDQTEFAGATQVYPSAVNFLAGTTSVFQVDSSGNVLVGGAVSKPNYKTVTFTNSAVGTGDRNFFIADAAYTVTGIREIHSTAETTAATLTGVVGKQTGAGTVTSLMSNTFNLKGTANTQQNGTLSTTSGVLSLSAGDILWWDISGSSTELAGLFVEVDLAPGGRSPGVSIYLTNAAAVDTCFFIANHPMKVSRIDYRHNVAASAASNVQVVKDTGTDAPGAGTDLLTNDSNAGFECDGTANTVQNGVLDATATTLLPGNRLSLDFSGTLTSLAGIVITITFEPFEELKDVTFWCQANVALADRVFFIADRNYEIVSASAVWSTPASAGNAQLTVDRGTTAPGAGTDLLSMDINAGFQIDGTANTVEVATWIDTRNNYMIPGDRLSVDYSATTSLVGFVTTVTLRPV